MCTHCTALVGLEVLVLWFGWHSARKSNLCSCNLSCKWKTSWKPLSRFTDPPQLRSTTDDQKLHSRVSQCKVCADCCSVNPMPCCMLCGLVWFNTFQSRHCIAVMIGSVSCKHLFPIHHTHLLLDHRPSHYTLLQMDSAESAHFYVILAIRFALKANIM